MNDTPGTAHARIDELEHSLIITQAALIMVTLASMLLAWLVLRPIRR